MEPAALFPRLGKHIAQRLPEPECSVADDHRQGCVAWGTEGKASEA